MDVLKNSPNSTSTYIPHIYGKTPEGDQIIIVGLRVKLLYVEDLLDWQSDTLALRGESTIQKELYELSTGREEEFRAEETRAFILSVLQAFYGMRGGLERVEYGPYVLRDGKYRMALRCVEKEKT